MACARCGGRTPPTPFVRPNLPTVVSWGPFDDHVPLPREQAIALVESKLMSGED